MQRRGEQDGVERRAGARSPDPLSSGRCGIPAERASGGAVRILDHRMAGTPPLRPAQVAQLQAVLGNRAVGTLLQGVAQRATGITPTPLAGERDEDEDEMPAQLRGAAAVQREESAPAAAAPSAAANRTGLPDALKQGVEALSGVSLDDVRVHYDSSAPARVAALAYARGTEIHVGPGQQHHLPHEAWHVVQQKQGRVKPTLDVGGVAVNDDVSLEREADVMGQRAAGG